MHTEWDESFFGAQRTDASVYWVCFWSAADDPSSPRHDPRRVTGAESVADILAWLSAEKGERRFELFVETVDHVESRELGWIAQRRLIRLAGDFRPSGVEVAIPLTDA